MGVFLEPGEEPVLRPESRIAIRRISAITVGTHQYGLVSGNSCLPVSAQCGSASSAAPSKVPRPTCAD
jgi:hypothetical protein